MAEGFFAELSADLLRLGHSVRFRATGESMHPTIRQGDVIVVKPVAPSAVRFADIILYQAQKGVVAHRVVGRRRTNGTRVTLLVRGDAMDTCDEPVQAEHVLGKVTMVERGDRLIVLDRRSVKFAHLLRFSVCLLMRKIESFGL